MTYWVEEHFGAEEALIANLNVDHVAVDRLVDEALELCTLHGLVVEVLLRVILGELLVQVFANVAVLLLDLRSDLKLVTRWQLLLPITQHLQGEVGDVSAGQWDVLHATRDDIAITDWEDVSNTIARVNDSSRHRAEVEGVKTLV